MHSGTGQKRWRTAALSLGLFTAMGLAALPAEAADHVTPAAPAPVHTGSALAANSSKLAGGLDRARAGRRSVFVELAGKGAADAAAAQNARVAGEHAANQRRADVAKKSDAVLRTARGKDKKARKLFEVSNAVPGIAVNADASALQAIAARSDVVKVSPLVPKKVSNAGAAQLTRVLDTWRDLGNTGKGVTVGVIDTGLDYTHADFGGPGTPAAYQKALANETDPTWRSKLPELAQAKVLGGKDFVGNDYDANPTTDTGDPNPTYQPVPNPDPNPIDCGEHGTHVAGTAAGYGVAKSGKTFTGNYSKLSGKQLYNMKVGPGMAPSAGLYSLKVFGCTGSTDVVIPALDWALDPNGDGDFSDHLDIVNLSLGSDYGTVDDPENAVIDEIAAHGVLPVIAMGNNGDLTDTGGSPGNAVRSLAVASTVDAYQLRDGLQVNAPSGVKGIAAGQVSSAYDWPNEKPVTGDVVAIPGANADGCEPLSATDAAKVAGKVAWLEWDDNDATRRCGSAARADNARDAGAIGAIFTSSLNVFSAGILGDADIPVFQLPKAQTDRLRPAVDNGLNVTFDKKYLSTIQDTTPSINDTISSFSSRGTHGSLGVVKPDVAAPGDTIASAKMGSGNDVTVMSGTSMATPHTVGISALVKAAHPAWSTEQIKAAVMNTAGHDVYTKENHAGLKYGPARVGAGRVDALSAVSTNVLAYDTDVPGAVSASFGVVPARIGQRTVTKVRHIAVENTGSRSVRVSLSYDPVIQQPGVSYSVSPSTMDVGGHQAKRAKVTMRVVSKELRHTIDPTMARDQLGVGRQFVSDASGRVLVQPRNQDALRVPVYGAAKPVSETKAKARHNQIVLSGKGVSQGAGPDAYNSFASVLQLGARSGDLPVCTTDQVGGCTYNESSRAGDLKYVGAGSNSDWLWFGIATQTDWATIGNTIIPYVDFDTNGDNKPDYEAYVQNLTGTDVLVSNLVDLNAQTLVDQEPVNFNFGDTDTNVFDNNVLLIPVFKGAIKAPTSGTFPVKYVVGTADLFQGGDIDDSPLISYDAGTPAVSTEGPLYRDQGHTAIDYTLGSTADRSTKALVLHLHGRDGHRAEVVNLRARSRR